MKHRSTGIPGVVEFFPDVHGDGRGTFVETFHRAKYAAAGLDVEFAQDMRSYSSRGVLRGLHFQIEKPQGHFVTVAMGRVFDVGLDLRRGSPTFGKCYTAILDGDSCAQVYLPPGLAHGFCVLSETAEILYKCTDFYSAGDEGGVIWSDPELGIEWPVGDVTVSDRDANLPRLRDIPESRLPAIAFDALA